MSSSEAHPEPPIKIKGLPPGWRREVVVRKNGQSAGKTDIYYYSPCGKKFRSKPQIARFLGETADLGCFDFSRAGTPGDGSQRRRARDRSAKKNVEQINKQVPLVRPLTNNPLRPSGPIRRTCGVIKLPVIWVAPPTDDDLKNDVMSAPLPLPANLVGQAKPPLEASKPPQQVTTLVAPISSGVAELVVPALWENRLVGVKPCDHETGMEIVVAVNKPQNGISVCGTGALPDGVGATTTAAGMNGGDLKVHANTRQDLPAIQNLMRQQQKKANLMTALSQTQTSLQGGVTGISTTSPAAQSLIQSLKSQQPKHLVSSATLVPQSGMLLTSASLSNLLRQQQQLQQQHGSVGLTVTSGRTTTSAVNSTAVGSVSSIGMAAVGNGRLSYQDGGVGGGSIGGKLSSHVHHTGGAGSSNQPQQIKLSLTGGAASTNAFGGGSVSSSMVSNGPTIMNMDTGSDIGGTSKFVSDSEIQLQEEKVRQLRQQLLAAAQAAAKGSAVV